MPAWSFHIKLATEISNTLALNKEEENGTEKKNDV